VKAKKKEFVRVPVLEEEGKLRQQPAENGDSEREGGGVLRQDRVRLCLHLYDRGKGIDMVDYHSGREKNLMSQYQGRGGKRTDLFSRLKKKNLTFIYYQTLMS